MRRCGVHCDLSSVQYLLGWVLGTVRPPSLPSRGKASDEVDRQSNSWNTCSRAGSHSAQEAYNRRGNSAVQRCSASILLAMRPLELPPPLPGQLRSDHLTLGTYTYVSALSTYLKYLQIGTQLRVLTLGVDLVPCQQNIARTASRPCTGR